MSGASDWNNSTPEQRQKYIQEWTNMMVTIWREKIERLHVIDTGTLLQDITGNFSSVNNMEVFTITHKFLEYGIFQELGVGRGYSRDNGGNLDFLDPNATQRKSKHRQKSGKVTGPGHRHERKWFSKKYYASIMVMKEEMAQMYGQAFAGIMSNAFNDLNSKLR
jgi:hypothetical protein